MGACSPISGVIVSPAVISGPVIGCVNSFPFVRWFWFWFWWLVDATICATDMHCRYAPPIWCDDMQGMKTEKAKSILLLALILFVIRYFTFVV
jgi:hypothetical protein